jgi:hypothetical protein
MVLERIRPFRLVERGGAGLACDADGIGLGGIALASVDRGVAGAARYVVRSAGELSAILGAAYGPQRDDVVQRRHRGLCRAASALEAENLALAAIETVMLALPRLDADAMAKLASLADLEKGGDSWSNEPRLRQDNLAAGSGLPVAARLAHPRLARSQRLRPKATAEATGQPPRLRLADCPHTTPTGPSRAALADPSPASRAPPLDGPPSRTRLRSARWRRLSMPRTQWRARSWVRPAGCNNRRPMSR